MKKIRPIENNCYDWNTNYIPESLTKNAYGFNPIQDGHLRGCSRNGEGTKMPPLPKICHTYPTMKKLGTVILT